MHRIIALVLFSTAVMQGYACDVCGCSSTGFFGGFAGLQNSNYIGIKLGESRFTSHHPTLFANEVPVTGTESFQRLEMAGRYAPLSWLQFSAVVPVQRLLKHENGSPSSYEGFGDVTVLGHVVWRPILGPDSSSRAHQLRFALGGGIKLPTGKYGIITPVSGELGEPGETSSAIIIPGAQPGTGSLDGIIHLTYLDRFARWGIMGETSWRVNGTNKYGYRFGRNFTSAISLARWINIGSESKMPSLTLLPMAGMRYDRARLDMSDAARGIYNNYSGGYTLNSEAGLQVLVGRYNLGVTWRMPLIQEYARGYIVARAQYSFQFNFYFNSQS